MSKNKNPNRKSQTKPGDIRNGGWGKPDSTPGRAVEKRTRHPETDPVGKPRRPKPTPENQTTDAKETKESSG